jgi:glycosyltransferase involved in cell wall biosynthesis
MRPLRILHVLFSLDAGGMENGVVNVSAALPPAEFEVHACCLARGGEFVRRFPNPRYIHVIGKSDGFSLPAAAALSRQIHRLAPDIIHTHNLGPLIYTVLAAADVPILHGEHAELTPAELRPHRRFIRRLLYRRASCVHTVSHSLRESLIRDGFPAGKIEVVVNGVDTARFQPGSRVEARRQTGLPTDATLIGLVGRFGPFKRHADLIQAFEQLAPSHPSLALLFAGGGGPLEEDIRLRAASSPFASRIHLAGFHLDPRPWYRALDLLVIPSVNEGLSNALLEAMASGIPALAHTACGNPDVIQDSVNGFLRDLSTTAQLRDALDRILAHPAVLPALGGAARRTVETGFAFPGMVAGYERLYRRLASGAPGPG